MAHFPIDIMVNMDGLETIDQTLKLNSETMCTSLCLMITAGFAQTTLAEILVFKLLLKKVIKSISTNYLKLVKYLYF